VSDELRCEQIQALLKRAKKASNASRVSDELRCEQIQALLKRAKKASDASPDNHVGRLAMAHAGTNEWADCIVTAQVRAKKRVVQKRRTRAQNAAAAAAEVTLLEVMHRSGKMEWYDSTMLRNTLYTYASVDDFLGETGHTLQAWAGVFQHGAVSGSNPPPSHATEQYEQLWRKHYLFAPKPAAAAAGSDDADDADDDDQQLDDAGGGRGQRGRSAGRGRSGGAAARANSEGRSRGGRSGSVPPLRRSGRNKT
jgi:hypothetical protein